MKDVDLSHTTIIALSAISKSQFYSENPKSSFDSFSKPSFKNLFINSGETSGLP